MAVRVATFVSGGRTLHADACTPLIKAHSAGEIRLDAVARGQYPGRRIPQRALPGLLSAGSWTAQRNQSWGLPWHCNEGIEITYLMTGVLPFALEEGSHLLRRGDFTITRPWQPHRIGRPNVTAGTLAWIILDTEVRQPHQRWRWPPWVALSRRELARLTDLLRYNEQPCWRASGEINAAFKRVVREAAAPAPSFTRLGLAINELLVSLLSLLDGAAPSLDDSLVARERSVSIGLQRVRDRLFEPWTLDNMAECSGLRRSRFAFYCQQLTGMAPLAWLLAQRFAAVCQLLRTRRDCSITQIQLECGFSSSQYFSFWFRKQAGCTPSEYRHAN